MVEINSIRTTECPICGCKTIVSESVETFRNQINEHCNGGRWEHRIFACGYHTHYCPNYGKEERLGKCAFDPEEAARAKRRETLRATLLKEIDAGECEDAYKERLRQALKYV